MGLWHRTERPYGKVNALCEIEERVTDAVTADDRIEDIEDFTAVALDKHTLYITFTAVTAQREQMSIEDEVNI